MEGQLIYHITTSAWWDKQSAADSYITETLSDEGFIHCSTHEQVKGTLERYYADQKGLFNVVETMARFSKNPQSDAAAFWAPAPLLAKLAAAGKTFN